MVLAGTAPSSWPAATRQPRARGPSLIDLWSCTYILRRLVGSAMNFRGLRPHRFLWAPFRRPEAGRLSKPSKKTRA
jgi:hypothetical protein